MEGNGWDEAENVEFQMSCVGAIHSVDFLTDSHSSLLAPGLMKRLVLLTDT